MDYKIPESVQEYRAEEMQRIETLIDHQMDFLSLKLTAEQRLSRMNELTELDKAKLVQLELSLQMREEKNFNFDGSGLFDDDKKFLASFTSEEIKNFLEFQMMLAPQIEKKNNK